MTTDAEVFDPSAKPLDVKELAIAIRDNICVHREFIKAKIDPTIVDQDVGAFSFKYLQAPFILPDGELFYGWMKFRGSHRSVDDATDYLKELLKFHDSKSKNRVYKAGAWVPLTSSKLLSKEFHTFSEDKWRINEQESIERQRKEIKEIRQREEQLKQGIGQFEEGSLDYYIMKKVTLSENEYTLERALTTVKECRKNMNPLVEHIELLEKEHPEYIDQALNKYNEERVDAGLENVPSFSKLR